MSGAPPSRGATHPPTNVPPVTERLDLDVVGIGNALVDVLSHEADAFITEHGLVKGAMTLIETERAEELYAAMGPGIEASGGSVANSIAGVASFGGKAGYLGRVHDDELGTVFAHDMRSNGVLFRAKPANDGPPTGRSLIVVTPDAQRTMNTYLGASAFFGPDDVDVEMISASRVTLLEGYLFDRPESKDAYWKASEIAHQAGRQVALSLSDTFCVERHRDDWLPLVSERVDILFANQHEVCKLWGCELTSAIERARDEVAVACITRGPEGSVVVRRDQTFDVAAQRVDEVIDTTGAGDLYAAGFLFGYTQDRPLPECGRLGSIAAAAVLGHTGARPGLSLHQLLHLVE